MGSRLSSQVRSYHERNRLHERIKELESTHYELKTANKKLRDENESLLQRLRDACISVGQQATRINKLKAEILELER